AYYKVKNPREEGEERVKIEKIIRSEDGKSVHLVIPNIQPVHQVEINLELEGTDGRVFEEQAYLTINAVPGGKYPNMKELTRERVGLRDELVRIAAEKRAARNKKKGG
ncbi:MAG: hypothetical protein AAGF67_11915, partial [Verrucomicrobiota bacterium]